MAGWSTFVNGSSLDCLENVGAYHGNGCCLTFEKFDPSVKDHVDDANDGKVRQKCLFYQLLLVHLRVNCSRGITRPVPVMLGDGQAINLYKLFSLVKKRGGYVLVTKKGLWGSVAKDLGLNLGVLASLKLVYDKYLNEFEGWLRTICGGKNFKNRHQGCDGSFKSLLLELEKEFRDLSCPNSQWKQDGHVELEPNKIIKYIDLINQKTSSNFSDTKNQDTKFEDVKNIRVDNDEKVCNDVENDLDTSNTGVANKEFNSHKRKRESLSGMLNWMKHTARHPLDLSIKSIPEPSKWYGYKGKDFWVQILRAREVMLLRQNVEPNGGSPSFQKVKMCPGIYEDHVTPSHHSRMKLRCSERLHTSVKTRLCSCCNTCSAATNKATSPVNIEAEKGTLEETTTTSDLLAEKVKTNTTRDDALQKQVSVGLLFQAEIPEWTGEVFSSDSKWLGTQVWPLKYNEQKPATETDSIGKGRQEKCSCQFQGSIECVRFHIAEKRMKLKLELGTAFFHWGFDHMGEEVSLQWTEQEEKKFKDIMRSNLPSQIRWFWNNSYRYFTKKTRRNLVSYYFNVYLIQRRSYQNRVSPRSVDSDDDELEFGSLSDRFGMVAVKGPSISFLECSENKQYTDLG